MKNIFIIKLFVLTSYISFSQFWDVTTPTKLGGTVNTEFDEILPIFSSDSSTLFFTRSFSPENIGGVNDQDIWFSTKDKDGMYTSCSPLSSLNSKYNNGVFGINKSGTAIYLIDAYEGKKDQKKGCAVATGKNGLWSFEK